MTTSVGITVNGLTSNATSSNQISALNTSTTSTTQAQPPASAYLTTTTNTSVTVPSQQLQQTATNSNRLLFNRLATERKTVHVMGSNLNKDLPKRDRQMLSSYNHATANTAGGMNPGATGTLGGTNTLQQNYFNNTNMGPSTLDYNSTGRSHTNGGSFLQKLSSKFTRR